MMIRKIKTVLSSLLLCIALAGTASNLRAHHSTLANFDSSQTVIIHGTITGVKMVNPHASFTVEVETENGDTAEWLVELVSKNALIRLKFDMDRFEVGTKLKVSGWQGRRANNMYFTEAVFADGTVIKKQDTFGQPLL